MCLEAIKSCLTSISSARLAATTHEDERLSKNNHGRLFEGPITMRYTHTSTCLPMLQRQQKVSIPPHTYDDWRRRSTVSSHSPYSNDRRQAIIIDYRYCRWCSSQSTNIIFPNILRLSTRTSPVFNIVITLVLEGH